MIYKNGITILFIFCIIGCNSLDPNNSKPVIQAVIISPDTITAGKSGLIECKAFDPDNDNLTYKWETTGYINGSGKSIFYTPGSCCGQPQVTIIVEDGKDGIADTTIQVPTKYE